MEFTHIGHDDDEDDDDDPTAEQDHGVVVAAAAMPRSSETKESVGLRQSCRVASSERGLHGAAISNDDEVNSGLLDGSLVLRC